MISRIDRQEITNKEIESKITADSSYQNIKTLLSTLTDEELQKFYVYIHSDKYYKPGGLTSGAVYKDLCTIYSELTELNKTKSDTDILKIRLDKALDSKRELEKEIENLKQKIKKEQDSIFFVSTNKSFFANIQSLILLVPIVVLTTTIGIELIVLFRFLVTRYLNRRGVAPY